MAPTPGRGPRRSEAAPVRAPPWLLLFVRFGLYRCDMKAFLNLFLNDRLIELAFFYLALSAQARSCSRQRGKAPCVDTHPKHMQANTKLPACSCCISCFVPFISSWCILCGPILFVFGESSVSCCHYLGGLLGCVPCPASFLHCASVPRPSSAQRG